MLLLSSRHWKARGCTNCAMIASTLLVPLILLPLNERILLGDQSWHRWQMGDRLSEGTTSGHAPKPHKESSIRFKMGTKDNRERELGKPDLWINREAWNTYPRSWESFSLFSRVLEKMDLSNIGDGISSGILEGIILERKGFLSLALVRLPLV